MILSEFLSEALIYAAGWTIVHTLWQGAVVAVLLWFLLACTRGLTSHTRYLLAATGLLLIAGMAVPTFLSLYHPVSHTPSMQLGALAPTTNVLEAHVVASEQFAIPNSFPITLRASLEASLPVVVLVWLAGIALLTAKFLAEFAYTLRLRHRKITAPPLFWQSRFEDLCRKAKVRAGIELVESALVQIPMVIGLFKPIILLPLGTLAGLPPQQVEAILVHELAHIRRYDYLVNILQTMVGILFFYHPAVWWLSARMRIEREHCCDDIAVAVLGNPVALVKALAGLQERAIAPRPALAATGNKYYLLHRIRRIAGASNNSSTPVERGAAVLALAVAICIMSMSAHASFASHNSEAKDSTTHPKRAVSEVKHNRTQTRTSLSTPDGDQLNIVMDENGKRRHIEATIDSAGAIKTLSVNGKTVPPEEFAKYQPQITEALKDQEQALYEQELAVHEQAIAQAEQEAAMAAQEQAEELAQEQADQLAAEMEAETAELEAAAAELDRQAAELENQMEGAASRYSEALDSAIQKRVEEFEQEVEARALKHQIWSNTNVSRKQLEQYQKEVQKLSEQLQASVRQIEQGIREREQSARQRERDARRNDQSQTRAEDSRQRAEERRKQAEQRRTEQEKKSNEIRAAFETELLKDKAITDAQHYSFKLTDTELYINGKKQPQSTMEKYKKLYSERSGKPFSKGSIIDIRKP